MKTRFRFSTRVFSFVICLSLVAQSFAAFNEFCVDGAHGSASNVNAGSTTGAPLISQTGQNWTQSTRVFECGASTDLSGVIAGMSASVFVDGASETGYIAQIESVNDGADTVTMSATKFWGTAPTDGTANRSLRIGGVLLGPNGASMFPFNITSGAMQGTSGEFPRINIRNSVVYNITGGTTNNGNGPIRIQGYTTTFGDGGMTRITGRTNEMPYTIISSSGNRLEFSCLILSTNGFTNGPITNLGDFLLRLTGTDNYLENLSIQHSYRDGIRASGAGMVGRRIELANCNKNGGNGFAGIQITEESDWRWLWAHGGTRLPYFVGDSGDCHGAIIAPSTSEIISIRDSIFSHNGGSGVAVTLNSFNATFTDCVFASNVHSGLRFSSTSGGVTNSFAILENNIFADNEDYGVQIDSTAWGPLMQTNAFWNNGSGEMENGRDEQEHGHITLSANPFVDMNNGNFALNDTAGAGADLRGTASRFFLTPTDYSSTTLSFPDIGAAQHQDSGGGGGGTRVYIGN